MLDLGLILCNHVYMLKRIILCIALLSINSNSVFSWDINDVSYLMKLPKSNESPNYLLKADSGNDLGILIPKHIFEKIGVLSNGSNDSKNTYQNLRALSFRFDPCPAETDLNQKCRPEIRIVFQPVVYDKYDGKFTTEDAAIHTFYRLTERQFNSVKSGLMSLKVEMSKLGITTEGVELGIHPAVLNQKTSESFTAAFNLLMLKNIGESNLYKVTFMKLFVPDNWWKFFVGFLKDENGQWVNNSIPRHGGTEMDIINDATSVNPKTGQVDEMDAGFFVIKSYPYEDDLRYIISTAFRKTYSSSEADVADFEQFKDKIGATHRFQNPKITNPLTVDCAHCHYSDAAQLFAKKVFPELTSKIQSHKDKYKYPNSYNTINKTNAVLSTKIVRAFGYMNDKPAIMTRTIHDSIESAEWLNKN